MVHSPPLLPCHVRHLSDGAIELMPIVLPMTLTRPQRRALAAVLLSDLDEEEPATSRILVDLHA